MKKAIGFAPSSFCALANRRKANKLLGTTQHKPPISAETAAGNPPNVAAIAAAMNVAINCKKTTRSMPGSLCLAHAASAQVFGVDELFEATEL
jgi:hypothetical protein